MLPPLSPEIPPLRLACIGAFGHTCGILSELRAAALPHHLVGWAPAYPGEEGSAFCASLAAHYGDIPIFSTRHALLAQARPTWAIVSSRLDHIAPVAGDFLLAGVHVIAEKPLAIRLDALASLESAWRSSRCHLSAMLTMENEPAFLAARQAVSQGRIGRVLLAEARKSYKWGSRPDWFARDSLYGGTFPWIGIHALDILHHVASLRFTGGAAFHANLAHPSHPACQDVCLASLTTAAGALAHVSIDIARPGSAPTWGDDWCRIVGSEGIIEAHASQGWCRLLSPSTTGAGEDIPLPPRGRRFADAIRSVLAGDLLIPATESAFHLTAVSLHARDAAASASFSFSVP